MQIQIGPRQQSRPSKSTRLRELVLDLLSSLFRGMYGRLRKFHHKLRNPPYKPLILRRGTQSPQSQSSLLALPAELRRMIWECVVAENPIVLYRKNGRIAYDYMKGEGPRSVVNITPEIMKQLGDVPQESKSGKLRLLAVLQTCQMFYVETIQLLYQANTFVCLQNTTLSDFCNATLPSHMSLIRSLHIHFQFRELEPNEYPCPRMYRFGFPSPWDELTFKTITDVLYQFLPNLRALSIFLQGPLIEPGTYADVAKPLKSAGHELKSLEFMAVRFPRPVLDRRYPFYGYDAPSQVNGLLKSSRGLFRVVQPPVELGQNEHDVADLNTQTDSGWRVGTLYVRSDDGLDAVRAMNYAVFTEKEEIISD